MNKTRYLDLDCIALRNENIELLVTESVGPRIIRLNLVGGENVFAELPDMTLDSPGADEKFKIYGGHRFWHAPQVPARTHLPDNRPVFVESIPNGVVLIQETEKQTGMRKSLQIALPDNSGTVVVDHILTNEGLWPVESAPWGITQLREGGLAICPQTDQYEDPDGSWPNRSIALWPFTSINNPHIHWGDRFIFVQVNMQKDMLKFGFPNPVGWLAYQNGDTLFVKHAAYEHGKPYFDRGSSSHIFCMPGYIELETLGPRTTIAPGESVTHREIWTLIHYPHGLSTPNEDEAAAMALKLKLNR